MTATLLQFPEPSGEAGRAQYLALRDRIALNIEMGRVVPGTRLPSERQLQTEIGTARGTIRQALAQLEAEGLIYRRDRSGWYVSPPAVTYDPTRWAGFMCYVLEQGRVPGTETLDKHVIPANAGLADIFRIAPGSPLFLIERRRTIDGRPVLIAHRYPENALRHRSRAQPRGHAPLRADQRSRRPAGGQIRHAGAKGHAHQLRRGGTRGGI
jgi:DNA-binding GntR family transcriptional regulator